MNHKLLEFIAGHLYNKFFLDTKCQMTLANQTNKISLALDMKDMGKIQVIISKDEWITIQDKVLSKLTNDDRMKLSHLLEIILLSVGREELIQQLTSQMYNIRTLITKGVYSHSIDIPPKLLLSFANNLYQ